MRHTTNREPLLFFNFRRWGFYNTLSSMKKWSCWNHQFNNVQHIFHKKLTWHILVFFFVFKSIDVYFKPHHTPSVKKPCFMHTLQCIWISRPRNVWMSGTLCTLYYRLRRRVSLVRAGNSRYRVELHSKTSTKMNRGRNHLYNIQKWQRGERYKTCRQQILFEI